MAIATVIYGTTTAFTCTLASLGDMAAREVLAISNTSTKGLDYQISGLTTVGAAAATGDSYILLGGYDGTTYTYPLTGADAAVTLPRRAFTALDSLQYGQLVPGTSLIFGTKINLSGLAATTAVGFPTFQYSQAFQEGGLAVPQSISLVFVNCQGQAHDATAGHFALRYTAITQNIA